MPRGLICGNEIQLTNVRYPHVFTYSRPRKGARHPISNAIRADAGLTRAADSATMRPAGSSLLDDGATMFRYLVSKMDDGEYIAMTNRRNARSLVTFEVKDHEVVKVVAIHEVTEGEKEDAEHSTSGTRLAAGSADTNTRRSDAGRGEDQG